MKQKRKRLIIGACVIVLTLITICLAYVLGHEERAQQYIEDFQAKAVPVALEKAKIECFNEALAEDQCNDLVAVPLSESSSCGYQLCWTVYVHSQNEEIYSTNITVVQEGDKMVVVDYLRNKFDSSN